MIMKAGSAAIDITPKPGVHKTLDKNSLELQNWRVAIDPLFAKRVKTGNIVKNRINR